MKQKSINSLLNRKKETEKTYILALIGDLGGSAQYRMIQPLIEVAENNQDRFEIQVAGALKHYDIDFYDIFYLQRQYNPKIYQNLVVLKELKPEIKIICEIDDYLFANQVAKTSPASQTYNNKNVQGMIKRFIALADVVVVSTEFLGNEIKKLKLNDSVVVCPNYLPEEIFAEDSYSGISRPADEFRIVWAGSSTHYDDLQQMVKGVIDFIADHEDSKLIVMGQDMEIFREIIPKQFEYYGFVKFDLYPRLLKSFKADVAIMPLIDNPFNRAKSDVKFIEMAYNKYLTIADNVGPYKRTIEHKKTGLLVNKFIEWKKHLNKVYNVWSEGSEEEKLNIREMVMNAHKYVINERLIKKGYKKFEEAIELAMKVKPLKPSMKAYQKRKVFEKQQTKSKS